MEWYASITIWASGYQSTLGLAMDGSPETSLKENHIYIDHIAIDGNIMFGTARRAAVINSDLWYWCIDILDTTDASQIFDTTS